MSATSTWVPAPGTVRVRVAALREDTCAWSAVERELRDVGHAVDGLVLGPQTLAPLLRMQEAFEQARVLWQGAVAEGAVAAAEIATTLSACADAYARDERENRHAIARIW